MPTIAAGPRFCSRLSIKHRPQIKLRSSRQRREKAFPARGGENKLPAPGMLPRRFEMAVTLHRRAHQEAIAFADDALDIALLDMRMADDHIMLLAGVDHALHPFE